MYREDFIKMIINGSFMKTINSKNIYYYADGIFWVYDGTTHRYFNPNDISMQKDYMPVSKNEFLKLSN